MVVNDLSDFVAIAGDQLAIRHTAAYRDAVSGGYFGWPPGTLIVTSFGYLLSSVVTAAASWTTRGVGNTVQISASTTTGSVGDVVWVGGVGANQFQIISIVR